MVSRLDGRQVTAPVLSGSGQGLDYKIMGRFFSGLAQATCGNRGFTLDFWKAWMVLSEMYFERVHPSEQRDQQQLLDIISFSIFLDVLYLYLSI